MKKVGIAGATGLVGDTLISLLESGPYKIEELRLFASEKSAGKKVLFRDKEIEVGPLSVDGFKGLDIAFFCVENELARQFVPEVAKFCPVIDKSSEFRLKEDVPLVVPEVNPETLKGHKNIIGNPNCTTIPLVVAVNPLHQEFGLKEIFLATYQSVSGAGRAALEQLYYESEFFCVQRQPDTEESPFPVQIVDNVIPWIGGGDGTGNSGEEQKTVKETQKILGLPDLKINSTCVRVPITVGHSLAVTCRFEKKVNWERALELLKKAPGVVLRQVNELLTPLFCRGKNDVFVGRVRPGATENDLNLWIVADNLYKGAATNALQIAELLFKS
ncbi:MAG: aspartate-semialdehyde dehydrogenase [candidate division WOR-3 bacterium]|jgi:aspartate-semialdehyde dehydrogenase|nr:aspartate-semialdehyde dehydrogenase [candidate division WOR-3 bacterium]MCR4424484.1 aspartate-semialdehyde dehydrogenase [candidate division WOR-3 bacterium]MDH7519668.1 aspartate-semialdehyde dehydrogenase [bacterium]